LPRARGDYLRIVMAAGRCFQTLSGMRGTSEVMQRARSEAWAACFGDSLRHALELERVIRDHDVLILGETGTGKEAFAHAMQTATPGGPDGEPPPRSAINAAAIPDTLVESELFGHVKGAFTGATETRIGRLRTADGGAFFLDEVGDLPSTTQVKLLRVIETNEVYPVGSDTPYTVDIRYIAATHKDLASMVDRGEFRADFYERLAGNVLTIPPLRERPEDIVEIGRHFVDGYLRDAKIVEPAMIESWLRSNEARDYAWPGNVRELQNALRNLMLGLQPDLRGSGGLLSAVAAGAGEALPPMIRDAVASMQDVTDWYMERVLVHTEHNYTQAAKTLGVDRSTVRRRTKQLRKR
jgi:transcriptional regulator with PAS, ATPase and Fis domain